MKDMKSNPAPSVEPSYDKELVWTEPRGFRSKELKGAGKWLFRVICLTFSIAFILMFVAYRLEMDAVVYRNLLVSAVGIVVLILVLRASTGLMRITVKITDKAIVWEFDEPPTVYRFGTVEHCELGNMSVGNRTYSVLVVALKNGDREIFCVDSSVSTQVLRATLEQRGVTVVTRTETMSEESFYS